MHPIITVSIYHIEGAAKWNQRSGSFSRKTSYPKIVLCLELSRLSVKMLLSLWNLACGAATEVCINLRLYSIRILDMKIRLIFAMAIHIPKKPVLILKRFLKRARSPLIFIMRFPIPIIATFLHMFTYLSAVENIVKVLLKQPYTWWRHDMEPVAVLLTLCEVNRLDSPHRGPVINAVFCVFFDVSLNMLLTKQSSYPCFKRRGAHVASL